MIVCGKYRLDQRLAGDRERYAATQIGGVERRVALALVEPDPQLGARVQRSSALIHQNIVRIFDLERDADGRLWVVSELVIGPPLSLCGALNRNALGHVALSVLRGLAHAHEKGVWHGQIAAENIHLSWAGEVKLAGFAIHRAGSVAADLHALGTLLADRLEGTEAKRVVQAISSGTYVDAGHALHDLEALVGRRANEDLRRSLVPPRPRRRGWVAMGAACALSLGIVIGIAAATHPNSEQTNDATVPTIAQPDVNAFVVPVDAHVVIDASSTQLVVDMARLLPECAKLLDEYAIVERCLLTHPATLAAWTETMRATTSAILISGDAMVMNRDCARRRKEMQLEERLCIANDIPWQSKIDDLFRDTSRVEALLRRKGASLGRASKVCQVVLLQFAALDRCKKPLMGTFGGLDKFIDDVSSAQLGGFEDSSDNQCRAGFAEVMGHSCAE